MRVEDVQATTTSLDHAEEYQRSYDASQDEEPPREYDGRVLPVGGTVASFETDSHSTLSSSLRHRT